MPRHAAHYRVRLRGEVYQARFTRSSEEHRISTFTGDKPTAEKEAQRIVREHDQDPSKCELCRAAPKASGGSIKSLTEKWLKVIAKTHSPGYGARALTDTQYIEAKFPDVGELTSKAWEAWKVELHTTPTERRKRLTWGSIANLANTVRAFLRWCVDQGHLESMPEIKNPTAKQMQADRAYTRPLDAEEQHAFLWALVMDGQEKPLHVYVALFETWMRMGALSAMTPRWVSFDRQTILIPSCYTKAQRGDVLIDLTPQAAEAIRAELGEVVELDRPIFGEFDYRYLFPRIAERAGIDLAGLTAHHVTRRTAATLAGAKPGASLAALKSQGGWRSSSVVDVYMRPSLEAARKVTR